ncbi:MAG: poly(R)-hydroxyalkanoic acid synthase subunit PhaE [Bacteroidia bacterium]
METNTFFEAWLETQKQLTENWTESNRKLQDSVKNGAAMTDGMEIYKEWLGKQTEITKTASDKATKTFNENVAENGEVFKNNNKNVSEIYNNWINAQREQMNKAMGNFQSSANPFMTNNPFASNPFTANNPFMTNPFAANNPFATNANPMKQVQDFQQQWWNNTQSFFNQSNQNTQPWNNMFQNWGKGLNDETTKEAWNNMTNISAAYAKFYEMWAPVLKSMQNNTFNTESFKNLFNVDAFKEMMDRSIAQATPVQTKELFQQFQNWTELASNYNKHVYQQFSGSIPENMKTLTPFLLFGNDGNNTTNPFAVYQRAISPLLRLFAPGKETELNELMTGMMEKVSVYGQKLAELQQTMYTTGAKTWETFLFENAEELKKGADLSNIQDVFQKWVNKNEASMLELFKTDAYSKIQAELLDLGLDIKQRTEKLAETLLQPLPIMLRSEADELYTTIYELRKRISQLEKQSETETTDVKEVKSSSKKKAATV